MLIIKVTRNELNILLKEHPELIGKTSVDNKSDLILGKSADCMIIDEAWAPIDEEVRQSYEQLKERLST